MLYFQRYEPATEQRGIQQAALELVHKDLGLSAFSDDLSYPTFRVDTYLLLSKPQKREAGDALLNHINQFLATFNADEQRYIYQYFLAARRSISQMGDDQDSVHRVTKELTALTTDLMTQLQFSSRAIEFTEKHVTLPNLDHVGKAAHYSEAFSFYGRDYYQLIAISLLCKFMCPIWGEFIAAMRQPYVDPTTQTLQFLIDERNNKELFCSTIILPVLESGPLGFEHTKLYNYMCNLITNAIKRVEKMSSSAQPSIAFVMAKYGYDSKRFNDYIYSVLLTKRIVGFDPWVPDADIMTHTHVNIDQTAGRTLDRMRRETRTMTRNETPEGGTDPDNISHLDNLSRISQVTADIPRLILFGVQAEISRLLERHAIDPALHRESVRYYRSRQTEPSFFNRTIMASLHAHWVGGAAMLRYLNFPTFIDLLALSQLMLLQEERTVQLALFLTCRTASTERNQYLPQGHRVANNLRNMVEFRELCQRYPGSAERQLSMYEYATLRTRGRDVSKINIENQLERIQNWILNYDHTTDLPSTILEILPPPWNERAIPGKFLEYDEFIMFQVCGFFLAQHPTLDAT